MIVGFVSRIPTLVAYCAAAIPLLYVIYVVVFCSKRLTGKAGDGRKFVNQVFRTGLLVPLLAIGMLWRILSCQIGEDRNSAAAEELKIAGIPNGNYRMYARAIRDGTLDYRGGNSQQLRVFLLENGRGTRWSVDFLVSTSACRVFRGELVEGRLKLSSKEVGGSIVYVDSCSVIDTPVELPVGFSIRIIDRMLGMRTRVRRRLDDGLRLLPMDQANYIRAVLLGDSSHIGGGFKTQLRNAGLMHLFVLSGFHLAIVYALIRKVLIGPLPLWFREIVGNVAIWLFIGFISPGASAIRAGAAISLHSLIKFSSRSISPDTELALIWTVLLICCPEYAADVGSYFSFAAIWGLRYLIPLLILSAQRLNYLVFRLPGSMLKLGHSLFGASTAAQLAIVPLSLAFFGTSSFQGILAMPLVIVPFYLSLLAALGCLISATVYLPALTAAQALLNWSRNCLQILCRPFAALGNSLSGHQAWVVLVLFPIYIFLGYLAYDCSRRGVLVSFSHVELRLNFPAARLSPKQEYGDAKEVRPELHDQSGSAPAHSVPDG